MALTRIQKLRQAEFAMAAYVVLCEHGIAGTTFSKVAQQAKVAKSNLLHYFQNKDQLIEAAARQAGAAYAREASAYLQRARTPWESVYAIIEANFSPTHFRPELIRAWVSLCAESQHNKSLSRLQTAMNRRMHSNLVSAFKAITTPEQAQNAAITMALLIQGQWLRCGTQPGGADRHHALADMEFVLGAMFQHHPDRIDARERMKEICQILCNVD